jgi:hypothetical protein
LNVLFFYFQEKRFPFSKQGKYFLLQFPSANLDCFGPFLAKNSIQEKINPRHL